MYFNENRSAEICPLNRGNPLNRGPLNRGFTVLSNPLQEPGSGKIFRHIDFLTSHSYLLIYLLLLLFESFTKSFTLYFGLSKIHTYLHT